jgi:hypothetical protein
MRPHSLCLILAPLASLLACDSAPLAPDSARLVVRAYLYAGQPATDIEIREALPLGATDSILPPVNDASVALIRDGRRFELVRSSGDSGYYRYPGTDLVIAAGDSFDLDVTRGDQHATASTLVPRPPESVRASDTVLAITPSSGTGIIVNPQEGITIHWTEGAVSDTASRLYYVVTQSVDENASPLRTGGPPPGRLTINPPTPADSFRVVGARLAYYGRHVARVYHVNREYAFLYDTRQQNTRDLNEPRTNVRGGLGIFSAFSSDSVSFVVVKMQ